MPKEAQGSDEHGTEDMVARIGGLHSLACGGHTGRLGRSLEALSRQPSSHKIQLVNQPNRHGFTPLQAAAFYDRPGNAELLLKHGADACRPATREQWTFALNIAALQGSPRLIKVLLNAGADPFLCDWAGLTPLEIAQMAGNRAAAHALQHNMDNRLDLPVALPALPVPAPSKSMAPDWLWRVRRVECAAASVRIGVPSETGSPSGPPAAAVVVHDHYSDGGSPPALRRSLHAQQRANAALYRTNSQPLTLDERERVVARRGRPLGERALQ